MTRSGPLHSLTTWVAVGVLAVTVVPAADGFASAAAADIVRGSVSDFVVRTENNRVGTSRTRFKVIPRMRVRIRTDEAGPIMIDYCAWIIVDTTGDNLIIRALVDGTQAEPGGAIFSNSPVSQSANGTRCFTWVMDDVEAGRHTIKIEWFSTNGGRYETETRTLRVWHP